TPPSLFLVVPARKCDLRSRLPFHQDRRHSLLVITCPQRSQPCGIGYFACGTRSMRGCTDRQVPRSRNTTVQNCMGSIDSHWILPWWILLFSSAKVSSP